MTLAERNLQLLKTLTKGICEDSGVRVEAVEERWFFNTERRVINVSARDLARHGSEYCAGILAHEIGHVFLSRYTLFQSPDWPLVYWGHLLNALEDPKV